MLCFASSAACRHPISHWLLDIPKRQVLQLRLKKEGFFLDQMCIEDVKGDLLPFCEPVLIVVSGVISACTEVTRSEFSLLFVIFYQEIYIRNI